jgi:hypothetical protein
MCAREAAAYTIGLTDPNPWLRTFGHNARRRCPQWTGCGYPSFMHGITAHDGPTIDLRGDRGFPEPVAVISLRGAITFRDQDDDGQPILIVSDGVTAIALDSGLSGLSFGVVVAAQRLAEAVGDFANSISARWQALEAPKPGRHRRNRRHFASRRTRLANTGR